VQNAKSAFCRTLPASGRISRIATRVPPWGNLMLRSKLLVVFAHAHQVGPGLGLGGISNLRLIAGVIGGGDAESEVFAGLVARLVDR